MNLSEEAKRQIIQDKLGINYGYLEDRDVQAGYGGDRFDKGYEFPSAANPLYHQSAYDKAVAEGQLMSKEYNIMKQGRNATGAGMTANEMKMFMGRPVQTSGYDRGPIRPRYDENGNLIPQRPTMMV